MERRKKIIQYVVALLATMAALLGGLFSGQGAAATDAAGPRAEGDPEVFTGEAFDTCVTPSLGSMNAWRKSHYRAVGVYIGGRGRACKSQPNLTRNWVGEVYRTGWRVLPIYVGSQAPCVSSEHKRHVPIDGDDPRAQGIEEGSDAVASAADLGMQEGSALYLDMEAYDLSDADCDDTTLEFVRGWSHEVRSQGYLPGYYSSATSGVRHIERARRDGVKDLPEIMWFARWNVPASLDGEPELAESAWRPHRRIHQYKGNVKEKYGGVTMTIDRNAVDAPVAVVDPDALLAEDLLDDDSATDD